MKTLTRYISIIVVFLFVSCGSSGGDPEPDRTVPVINIKSPNINTIHTAGNDLNIIVNLSDNEELTKYVITVFFSGTKTTKSIEEFSYNSDQDTEVPVISGTSYSINYNVEIPDNTKLGKYKFIIEVQDSSGNKSDDELIFSVK